MLTIVMILAEALPQGKGRVLPWQRASAREIPCFFFGSAYIYIYRLYRESEREREREIIIYYYTTSLIEINQKNKRYLI